MIITIDGPVASGKSSVARVLAKELKIYYLYTGLLYRAVAYIMNERDDDQDLSFIKNIAYDYGKGEEARPFIFYDGKDIADLLYESSVGERASIVSARKEVRDALIDLQRDVAKRYDIVADGRDCGTVVFPDADFKFYLTADVDVRATRLMLDETRGLMGKSLEEAKARLQERDRRDTERDVSPLTIPEGAVIIDNSGMTEKKTIEKFLDVIRG